MHISPSGQGCGLHILHHAVCNRVQRQKHDMEIVDILDIHTPTGGEIVEINPPYVGSGHYRQPIDLNRTEEAAGSNPARSTEFTLFPPGGKCRGFSYLLLNRV